MAPERFAAFRSFFCSGASHASIIGGRAAGQAGLAWVERWRVAAAQWPCRAPLQAALRGALSSSRAVTGFGPAPDLRALRSREGESLLFETHLIAYPGSESYIGSIPY